MMTSTRSIEFVMEPVVVRFAPEVKGSGIDPETLNDLAAYFRAELLKALSKSGYDVVTAPGAGGLKVKAAIAQIDPVSAENTHPAMKVSDIGPGGASTAAEGIDSERRQRDSQNGSRAYVIGGPQWYAHARGVLSEWAKRVVARLDEAHGKTKQ